MGKACGARNPQPCGLTTKAMHSAESGCFRSMLITVTGICTRNRVLRRVGLGVSISICETLIPLEAAWPSNFLSLTEGKAYGVLIKC